MGSEAQGCIYSITGDDIRENGSIPRNNSQGVIIQLAGVSCFSEVLAYDWESDGTIGLLPIGVDRNSTIEFCPNTTASGKSKPSWNEVAKE